MVPVLPVREPLRLVLLVVNLFFVIFIGRFLQMSKNSVTFSVK